MYAQPWSFVVVTIFSPKFTLRHRHVRGLPFWQRVAAKVSAAWPCRNGEGGPYSSGIDRRHDLSGTFRHACGAATLHRGADLNERDNAPVLLGRIRGRADGVVWNYGISSLPVWRKR